MLATIRPAQALAAPLCRAAASQYPPPPVLHNIPRDSSRYCPAQYQSHYLLPSTPTPDYRVEIDSSAVPVHGNENKSFQKSASHLSQNPPSLVRPAATLTGPTPLPKLLTQPQPGGAPI